MLASRLLSILMLLQTRGRMSATELAAKFEVSVRTIHRDIDQLSAAGVPVYADRGRKGGFQLMDGYRTKLTGLTQSEAEALFLAGLPGPGGAAWSCRQTLGGATEIDGRSSGQCATQCRAHRLALPSRSGRMVSRRRTACRRCSPSRARCGAGITLKLQYRGDRHAEPYPRKLAPLGLVLKGGVWYLVAQSGKSIRTYRLKNIHNAEITQESFARPKSFDLAAYWDKASREYEAGVYREKAELRLSQKGLSRLDLLGPYVVEAAAKTATKPDRTGWVRCIVPIESVDYGVQELMRLGEGVEVVGPPILREKIIATLAGMARHYRAKA